MCHSTRDLKEMLHVSIGTPNILQDGLPVCTRAFKTYSVQFPPFLAVSTGTWNNAWLHNLMSWGFDT